MKTMLVIGKIREADAKLKGVGKGNTTDADIMKELIYFILH
jgi:DNA polymerase-3 subunit delta